MDNATLRATILLGGHGLVLAKLFEQIISNTHAASGIAYAAMAFAPLWGLASAWRALVCMADGKPATAQEYWIGMSAMVLGITLGSVLVTVIVFWTNQLLSA